MRGRGARVSAACPFDGDPANVVLEILSPGKTAHHPRRPEKVVRPADGRFTVPLNQNKPMSHRWSWGVNTSVFSTQEIKATFFREFPIWVKMSVLD
jgi:hypothetical protein